MIQVIQNLLVGEAQNCQALRAALLIALQIVFLLKGVSMNISIYFYHKIQFAAEKIEDVGTKRMLATEAQPSYSISPQPFPQFGFSPGHLLAQLSCPLLNFRRGPSPKFTASILIHSIFSKHKILPLLPEWGEGAAKGRGRGHAEILKVMSQRNNPGCKSVIISVC